MVHLFKSGRTGRYYAQETINGRRRQFSCKTANRAEALKFATEKITKLEKEAGIFEANTITLQEFAEHYLRIISNRLSKGSCKAYSDSIKHFIDAIGNIRLQALTVPMCHAFIFDSGYTMPTASKHYRHLKRAIRLAVRWRYVGHNPFDHVDPPRVLETKKDWFTEEEFELLVSNLPTRTDAQRRFKRIVMIGRLTGARESEILTLSLWNLDFERANLYLKNSDTFSTKNRKDRTVPLSSTAISLLRDQLNENKDSTNALVRSSTLVFPNNKGCQFALTYISAVFREYCRRLFPYKSRLCFHSLRATFITQAILDGVPRTQVQLAVGHSTIRTTEGYAHLETMPMDQLRASLDSTIQQ